MNAGARGIVARLRKDGKIGPALDSIIRDVQANGDKLSEGRKAKVADAIAVINRARNGERNIAFGITDEELLRLVWARADDPRNAANRDKLRQAAFDALVGSWEDGVAGRSIVCINGRTARMVGSLALLDYDPENWELTTVQEMKNEIMESVKTYISRAAQDAAKSTDAKLRDVGRSYISSTEIIEVDEKTEAEFKAKLSVDIGRMVDDAVQKINRRANGAISSPLAEGIKNEAIAAI